MEQLAKGFAIIRLIAESEKAKKRLEKKERSEK